MFKKALRYIRAIPKRKHYLEFVTATLSIPVLLTAIFINIANLRGEEAKKESEPERIIVSYAPSREDNTDAEPTQAACRETVGPVEISYPEENAEVDENPLVVRIEREQEDEYCAVVWSYRINGGRWSEYDDKSLALYNLPNGPKILELRVKSVASGDEKILKRSFDYQGSDAPPAVSPTEVAATPGP